MRHRRFWILAAAIAAPALALAAHPCCAEEVALEYQTALGGDGRYGRFYVNYAGAGGGDLLPVRATSRELNGVRVPVSGFGRPVPPLVYHAVQDDNATAGDLKDLCTSYPLSCTLSGYGLAGGHLGELDLYQEPTEVEHHLITTGLPAQR